MAFWNYKRTGHWCFIIYIKRPAVLYQALLRLVLSKWALKHFLLFQQFDTTHQCIERLCQKGRKFSFKWALNVLC